MDEMNSSEFKAKCLALLEQVQKTGKPLRILKRGKPVAILYPAQQRDFDNPQASLRGTVTAYKDPFESASAIGEFGFDDDNLK